MRDSSMVLNNDNPLSHLYFLEGGGEMGERTRNLDWTATVLGSPEQWPQSLVTAISIMLNSRFPMFLWWGPELIQFYNDAYRPSLGNAGKHPAALGQRGEECWPEIWDVIKPLIDQVMAGGPSTWSEDQLLPIYRNNKLEDVYWTFSYSRVNDETGKPGGVLVTCSETTKQVMAYQEIEKAKDELEFAIRAAELGTWDLDPATNRFIGNERLKSWFGLKEDDEIDLSLALQIIAEEHRPTVIAAIQEAMRFDSGGSYDIEYTIIHPQNQQPRYVKAKGKALFNAQREVVRFSGTMQDITEQKTDELRKNDFIAMVSHELKTPLTSLSAIVQLLHTNVKKTEEGFMSNALEIANTQVRKMTAMINGFLNVSRLEAGKIILEKQEFDLVDLIKNIIRENELTISTHRFHFQSPENIPISADPDKIGSVITNLVNNAIKYSPAGKNIRITCHIEHGHVQVRVTDEGIGINSTDKEKLFERFYRVENSNYKHISGFGIGLYLSAEIIDRHNGSIGLESEPGKGSTFYFNLPLTDPIPLTP